MFIGFEPSNYSWFLNNYAIWIENGFNGLQKDYYKECTNVALWYGKIKGNRIQLIFFKNRNDYEHILQRDSVAWRIAIHYQFCNIVKYPEGANKEFITELIISTLMDIYKNGNINNQKYGRTS